jgi:hypothetical protein
VSRCAGLQFCAKRQWLRVFGIHLVVLNLPIAGSTGLHWQARIRVKGWRRAGSAGRHRHTSAEIARPTVPWPTVLAMIATTLRCVRAFDFSTHGCICACSPGDVSLCFFPRILFRSPICILICAVAQFEFSCCLVSLATTRLCIDSHSNTQRSKLIRSFLQSGESNSHFENRAPSIFGNGVGGAPSAPASPRFVVIAFFRTRSNDE